MGLVMRDKIGWALCDDPLLPSSASVVKALATEHQSHAAETLLAAAISGLAKKIATTSTIPAPESIIPKAAIDFYNTTSVELREISDALYKLLIMSKRLWPKNRALRVLQIGFSPLTHMLLNSSQNLLLTLFEPDRRRYENAELSLARHRRDFRLFSVEQVEKLGEFDLIVSVAGLHRLPRTCGMADLKRMLCPGGLLVAIEPKSSLFQDVVFGLDPNWFLPELPSFRNFAHPPISPLRSINAWSTQMDDAGFRNSRTAVIRCYHNHACLVVAETERAKHVASQIKIETATFDFKTDRTALIVSLSSGRELAENLRSCLAARKWSTSTIDDLSQYPLVAPDDVIFLPRFAELADAVSALTRRCLDIRDCAKKINGASITLWLIFSGALAAGQAQVDPVETGAWAFSRTLANEFTKLDVRRIDLNPGLTSETAAEQINKIVASGTKETELHVGDQSIRAVRVNGLQAALANAHSVRKKATRLERISETGQRLSWQPIDRKRPTADEVEVEIEAVGLNFRDLMFSLSLLPEDMLEDGFSGPTLGLECAGRIVRVGPGVETLKVGDRVMAFAASSFATHVTINSSQAAKLPENMSDFAAATIPVAFFTAYYALITQAKLSRREWVLIHGGAGAVGMAAIQIAQARGAHVIATAGSTAKRDLLRALGVAHVFDSRSTSFVDEIRNITSDGVDVVLNSLAGEAMERSIAALRPFGRFVELGKRDYVSNTHVGLRPFRKNLTYFGVDVDQVIGARKSLGDQIFRKIVRQFEKGTYVPLPYSVFDGEDVTTAFHLMQQSSHIGKIVVRPQSQAPTLPVKKRFRASAKGTHIVTGAFGGFGMETAKWLVEKGARHLVMIGRRGATTAEAKALLKDFDRRGVKVLAKPCDVTDRRSLEQLFEEIHSTMPPIIGVIHSAMVLDDGIIANLDADRFRRVLAPKIAGAEKS